MPIRNLWSLECGEVIAAEALLKNVKDCEVYFPLHDIGIDFLLQKARNMFQFKSRKVDIIRIEFGKNQEGTVGTVSIKRSFSEIRKKLISMCS